MNVTKYGKEGLVVKTADFGDAIALIVEFKTLNNVGGIVCAFYGLYKFNPYVAAGVETVLKDIAASYIHFNEVARKEGYAFAAQQLEEYTSYLSPFTPEEQPKRQFQMLMTFAEMHDTVYTIHPATILDDEGNVTPTYIPLTEETPAPQGIGQGH